MAVRSGAGTGVIVALVVTVLTSIFLLVLTIVFYAGLTEARESLAKSDDALSVYITPTQRNADVYKTAEAEAKRNRQSVAQYLQERYESLLEYVDPAASDLEQLQSNVLAAGGSEGQTLMRALQDANRRNRDLESQVQTLEDRVSEWDTTNAELRAQIDQLKQAHNDELASVQGQIAAYRDAADENRREVVATIDRFNQSIDTLRGQYDRQIDGLENDLDSCAEERVVLRARINDLENRINEDRIKGENPAMLVDGAVIDTGGSDDEIFINRGRQQRVVLGMTFEVYDDAASIRINPVTGELPRGKASIQVIKVGETTSTAKITRSVRGRPVVRADVIANAIYDPEYKFKFLIHGKFDTNGDGRPTSAEAEYLESLVIDWGGTVVTGDQLPGDLDFLVLGVQPPLPVDPPPDAVEEQINIWLRQREIYETYERLMNQASDAQIPVLNENRFLILIGHTNR